jgi:ABC-type transporter Mla subunit MlaD
VTIPNGRRKDRAAELPDAEARLRELLAEVHGATRDLDRLLREARGLINDNAKAAADAAFRASSEEMKRFSAHFQRQMNEAAIELNSAVSRAREQVINAITPTSLVVDDKSGLVRIEFSGELFDADVPVAPLPAPASMNGGDR